MNKYAQTIGWCVDAPFGDFAFSAPTPVRSMRSAALSERAVQACPAVNEYEKRLYQIPCAFDLNISIERRNGAFDLFVEDRGTRIDRDILQRFLTLMKPDLWRHPDRPVIQILLPYFFISDEVCFMTQLPPFFDYRASKWPGLLISGRFPIQNWPRIMNWAFEWFDTDKPVRLRRGDPLCYMQFETETPDRQVKLVNCVLTDELKAFRKGIEGMPKYVSNTFKIMDEAATRRPKKLIKEIDDG